MYDLIFLILEIWTFFQPSLNSSIFGVTAFWYRLAFLLVGYINCRNDVKNYHFLYLWIHCCIFWYKLAGDSLYDSVVRFRIPDLPAFALECLPNRNSLVYRELYGIGHEASTIFRGTLRYEGMTFVWLLGYSILKANDQNLIA